MRSAMDSHRERNPRFEKHVVDAGMSEFFRAQKHQAQTEAELAEKEARREAKIQARLEKKREKALISLEEGKVAWADNDEVYFEDFDRVMPIKLNNTGFDLAPRRVYISTEDLLMMLAHPDHFPNPRLVYSHLHNNYRIEWDRKDEGS